MTVVFKTFYLARDCYLTFKSSNMSMGIFSGKFLAKFSYCCIEAKRLSSCWMWQILRGGYIYLSIGQSCRCISNISLLFRSHYQQYKRKLFVLDQKTMTILFVSFVARGVALSDCSLKYCINTMFLSLILRWCPCQVFSFKYHLLPKYFFCDGLKEVLKKKRRKKKKNP